MVRTEIKTLEAELLNSISRFLKTDTAQSMHHWELLKQIQQVDPRAFLCGGAVRDILLSKLRGNKNIVPRDLDIVLGFEKPDKVAALFPDCHQKWNCYGGVEISHKYWSVDIWSLEKTWAFEQGLVKGNNFKDFPSTTFLDIEAVAVQLFSKRGIKREIYSKGFFEAILTNTIDINFEPNPNPKSCVVRALYVANKYAFKIGRRLAKYIVNIGHKAELEELEQIFRVRYPLRITTETINLWIKEINNQLKVSQRLPVQLPNNSKYIQLNFNEYYSPRAFQEEKESGIFGILEGLLNTSW
jgi:hypothetical protein